MASRILVSTGFGNGLLPDADKPSPELILSYCQFGPLGTNLGESFLNRQNSEENDDFPLHNYLYQYVLWIVTHEKWLYVCHICMCVDLYVCVRYSACITMCAIIYSLWPGDAIWRHISGSTSAQVMACCLAAPIHYLNQCWLIIIEVLWHSP